MPEVLISALDELEREYQKAKETPSFRRNYNIILKATAAGPPPLSLARNLTRLFRWEAKDLP